MQQLMSYMRSAMDKYNMISDGDSIAVGVSGGKDSLALLCALSEMRRFYGKQYSLTAITIDMQFGGAPGDFSEISELCRRLGVKHIIRLSNLYDLIFNQRKEKNPCSLCAKMRRGMLHDEAKKQGCNKVALGHHLDDAVQTFYMNLFLGGRIDCFAPVSYLSRKDLYLIRPMVFAYEKDVSRAARAFNLPIRAELCPMGHTSQRAQMAKKIAEWEKEFGPLRQKTINALQSGSIRGW